MAQPWKRIKEPEISSPAHAGCARPGAMLPTWTRPGGQVTVSTARAPCDPFSHHVAPSCCHAHCPSPTRVPLCFRTVPFSSVAQSCPVLCDPINHSTSGLPVHLQLPEFTQTHVIESVMPSSHLILCHPLLLLPSIFPSIRVISNKPVLHIRWPKYWSFSFSVSPSNEYSRLISLG